MNIYSVNWQAQLGEISQRH